MSLSPVKLVFVIPSLACGGAERVAVTLSSALSSRGHDITVVTTTSRPDFYSLSPDVHRVRLDLTKAEPGSATSITKILRTVARFPRSLQSLREAIAEQRPDAVVSFMDQANILTLASQPTAPVIITEHTDPNQHALGTGWRLSRRALYRKASHLVSASNGVDQGFSWLEPAARTVIPNPVAPPADLPETEARQLVSLGRLVPSKQFDHLLGAFATARPSVPGWHLRIVGDGPDRERLEQLSTELGLGDSVTFVGAVKDPFPLLAQAELFALTSRYEGFGNVLVEALSVGTPVVSYDCPSGPAEIIQVGHNGHLVPPQNQDALSATLVSLMQDEAERSTLADNARSSVEHFLIDTVASRWETLLEQVANVADRAIAP